MDTGQTTLIRIILHKYVVNVKMVFAKFLTLTTYLWRIKRSNVVSLMVSFVLIPFPCYSFQPFCFCIPSFVFSEEKIVHPQASCSLTALEGDLFRTTSGSRRGKSVKLGNIDVLDFWHHSEDGADISKLLTELQCMLIEASFVFHCLVA